VTTTVVNLRKSTYDAYIGRPGHGLDGYFGNPFPLNDNETRTETLERYRVWFTNRVADDVEFRARVLALKGKRLGCFCKPLDCHGDTIAAWVDAQDGS